ncbi:MAG: M15 family metallopeptidase [Phycisphaerales bacterium]|nr:M15 family metallopeptidase [Phycisphaerales bacterium]
MSTKIEDLAEPFRSKARAFISDLKANTSNFKCMGSDGFIVLETLRSQDTQIAYFSRLLASHVPAKYRRQAVKFVKALYRRAGLYEIADSEAIKPVSWTMESRHLEGEAMDIWPTKMGKIWWAPKTWEGWARMAEIAARHGIEAGYTWSGDEQDPAHFQEARE